MFWNVQVISQRMFLIYRKTPSIKALPFSFTSMTCLRLFLFLSVESQVVFWTPVSRGLLDKNWQSNLEPEFLDNLTFESSRLSEISLINRQLCSVLTPRFPNWRISAFEKRLRETERS